MTLGEKLQRLRTAAGLSQEDLAERLQVSRQAISKWELDKTVPDVKYIVELSELFGVTTDHLLKEAEPPPPQEQGSPPPSAAVPSPRPTGPACLVLAVSSGLFAVLLLLYLADYCMGLRSLVSRWPPLAVLLLAPAALIVSALLLGPDTPPREFRRGAALCFTLWGFSIALLLGFSEVVDDLLYSQVEGSLSIPLFLLFLTALLLPLWLTGRLLASRILKKRQ